MENRDLLRQVHYNFGQSTDVAVSYEDYNEILEVLIDQYISKSMMMNFKNCSRHNGVEHIAVPFVAAPLSYFMTKCLFFFSGRKGATNKVFAPIWLLNEFYVCWWIYTRSYPKRVYTKILADPGADGQYIRYQLSLAKPGLWKKLSRELYNKNFKFPEMLEYQHNTQFPTNFMDALDK